MRSRLRTVAKMIRAVPPSVCAILASLLLVYVGLSGPYFLRLPDRSWDRVLRLSALVAVAFLILAFIVKWRALHRESVKSPI